MLVTLSGILTLDMLVMYQNAFGPIAVTAIPLVVPGTVTPPSRPPRYLVMVIVPLLVAKLNWARAESAITTVNRARQAYVRMESESQVFIDLSISESRFEIPRR
jgi:hypothetical protein